MSSPASIVEGDVPIEAPELSSIAAELAQFQGRFADTFVFLARELRNLGLNVDAMSERTESLRSSRRGDLVAASVLTTRDMVEAFKREMAAFGVLNERVFKFCERMSTASEQLVATACSIGSMNRKLRVAGINVRLSATQLSDAGGSLAALTRELTGLASLSGERAASVASVTEEVGRRVSSLQLSRNGLGESKQAGEREVHSSLSDIFTTLDRAVTDLSRVVTQAGRVRNSLGHAALAIQRHDLLRQSIDHIRLALEEVEHEFINTANVHRSGSSDARERLSAYLLLSQQIGELGARALVRSQGELEELVGELRAALQILRDSTQSLAQTMTALDSEMEQRLSAPAEALKRSRSVLEHRLALAMECGTVIADLQEPLFKLEELLANLASVDHRLRNLVVMMRIEMPRLVGLDDPAGLIRGVNNCHTQFVEFLGLTEQPLEQFRGGMADIKHALKVIKKQHEGISDLVTRLHVHSEKLIEAGRHCFARVREIVNLGNEVLDTSNRCAEALDELGRSMVALQSARAACDELASRAGDTLAALERAGVSVSVREETLANLRQMVARFSAFADKTTEDKTAAA